MALEQAGDSIFVADRDGRIEYCNTAFTEVTGYTREDVLGKSGAILKSGKHSDRFYRRLWETILAGQIFRAEFVNRKKSGELYYEEKTIAPVHDADGNVTHFISTGRDVTEQKKAAKIIRYMAFHDSLTGLANRDLLMDRLSKALAQARRSGETLAILFLDLDGFKIINDNLGHAAGDGVLRAVAEHLGGLVREADTLARVGGDEFVVLLPAIGGAEDAVEVARRVLERLKQPIELEGREFIITGSIGIAVYPHDAEDAESLLRSADLAMYQVKEQAGNDYQVFTPAIHTGVIERLDLEHDLRQALQREEFVLHYQPLVDVRTGGICGVEALLRWQHGERGLVPPQEFVPVAEKVGLIVPLGEWVLRSACAQNRAWREAGFPCMPVAVNISPRQLQPDIIETIAHVLDETGLAPACLRLEITEDYVMQNAEVAIDVLRQVGEMGVEISVDDFGTGYSSLSYLKRLPIAEMKIDRSFVHDIPGDASGEAIVTAIIALAQNLNLRVVAEGVETQEQLTFLQERGCHIVQGYLFGRPVPAHEFEALLRQGGKLRAQHPAQVQVGQAQVEQRGR